MKVRILWYSAVACFAASGYILSGVGPALAFCGTGLAADAVCSLMAILDLVESDI